MEKENMSMAYSWEYCEESDILSIRRKNRNIDGSAELGDFIVDFDADSDVIGVEILFASEFLGELGIHGLDGIKKAELALIRKNNIIYINAKLLLPDNVQKVIPIPAPVAA